MSIIRRHKIHNYQILSLCISCRPLDWQQLSSLAQVFNSALSHLFTFEHLEINHLRKPWQDNTESSLWLEVLHPFASVKDLVLGRDLIELVAPALEDLAGERVTEVLPALQNLFVESRQPSEPVKKAIGKFLAARRLSGRPVTVHHRKSWRQDYVLWEVGDRLVFPLSIQSTFRIIYLSLAIFPYPCTLMPVELVTMPLIPLAQSNLVS
jgi:hypothetical protein